MTVGFKNKCDRETYITHLQNKKLLNILNIEKVKKGDAYFIPAGRVHAIGEGILIAEIQQTSDITYRIYDYERLEKGKPRDLHTEQAIDVIDFNTYPTYKSDYNKIENSHNLMVDCNYFTTNYINLTKQIEIDYSEIDSFVIYLCLSGELTITTPYNESIIIKKGMTTLIPAELKNLTLTPSVTSEILEVYIK